MLSITIPVWLLFAVAGLPTLLLLGLGIRLMRLKRHRNKQQEKQVPEARIGLSPEGFDRQMNQAILQQQIDAVFHAMLTILQTEQIKLKALVQQVHTAPNTIETTDAQTQVLCKIEPEQRAENQPRSPEPRPSVAEMINNGLKTEEIGRRLGLSQSEIALAMKIHAGRNGNGTERVGRVA
ncbi:hypothetical protein [Desulfatitalea tepidiphila]|uniref:hypothetical protein n=1 Tax=Desulfatitalea tepidiphila TaxID=1185843 RepID=UPI0006B4D041|nr:hypothetical protein [Desulfatitalea tepidiphila]